MPTGDRAGESNSMEFSKLKRGIIDAHCHVASTDFIPRSFIEGMIENIAVALIAQGIRADRKRLFDLYLAKMQDPFCDELAAEMAESGIEKAVLLLPDLTFALKDSKLTIEEMIEHHRAIVEKRPDSFYVFAGVDPRWGPDGISLFERAVTEYGFHGLKLYPPCGYSPSDKALYPLYEICAKYKLPVLTHTGPTSPVLAFDMARPILIDQAARDFPDVDFILAHGSTSYMKECAMLCYFRPNLFLDVSAFEAEPVEHLRTIFFSGINHKIIFGTDWPLFRLQGDQKSLLEALLKDNGPLEGLRPHEVDNFFGATINRLLNPS